MSTTVSVITLADYKQRQASRPDASVWVEASAGSGKTKVLTDRVLKLLLQGTEPQRILCLTFTKAAAAVMSNRLSTQLGNWATAQGDELEKDLTELLDRPAAERERRLAPQLFARVLDTPGGMKIMTLHAFCQSVLRRFPLEASVAAHFEVMSERDTAEMLDAARAETLARGNSGADPALTAALDVVTTSVHEMHFPELVSEVIAERARIASLIADLEDLERVIERVHETLGVGAGTTPEMVVEAACATGAFDEGALRKAAEILSGGSEKTDRPNARAITEWLDDPDGRAASFDTYLGVFFKGNDRLEPRSPKSMFTKAAAPAEPFLLAEQSRLEHVVEHRRKATVARATSALLRLTGTLLATYEHKKAVRALLDYDDLILKTRNLLESPGVAPWVLYKLDGGLDHVLIDEAQDTNPEQWQVVRALVEEFFAGLGVGDEDRARRRTVFAVGDVKQSIYSFQRVDPAAFGAMREHFSGRVNDARLEWDDVSLDVSFRSTRPILEAVDRVFAGSPARVGVVPDGIDLHHLPQRMDAAGLVEIWPPLTPRDNEHPAPWKPPIERIPTDNARDRLARLLARRIRNWLDEGERLRGQPIAPGDIMILVRRRGAFVEEMVRALKDLEVPVAGIDRMVLTEQIAVMDLVALGQFLLLPEDDLTLATVLKGPLIGLGEDELFELAHGRAGSLWGALRPHAGRAGRFGDAHAALDGLLRRVDFVRPYELYAEVLAQGGRRLLLSRLGAEAEDPIDEFMNLALAYERTNAPSLQGFLHWLAAGQAEVKRDLEQGGDEVRVMTVHGAKGLQAPIVILPDTLQMADKQPRLLWPGDEPTPLWAPYKADRDTVTEKAGDEARAARDEEYRRLLYVAMTRAEDRLYVCGWHTKRSEPKDCWYNLVRGALEGVARAETDPFLASCGENVDPIVLRLEQAPTATGEAPERAAPEFAVPPLPPWADTKPPEEPHPPRPLAPSRPVDEEPPVVSPLSQGRADRFHRGRLIHRLLQGLPDLPAERRRQACQRFLARRVHGLDEGEREAIVREVMAVLEDSRFSILFGPTSAAEVPLTGVVGGGSEAVVVSGQVDRLVVTEEDVLIVDYKTNRPAPGAPGDVPAAYLHQMAAYRGLLREVYPDRQVRCALLWTDGPRMMQLEDELLDPHEPQRAAGELPAQLDGDMGRT
ncbi:MAG: double-strand break repair helicase AddA [Alphaproteobacteria bacterium]